ncbi:GH25 family lysozyme [Companilactobacillus halodurans]|uniref:1,4-beta-N-acetylmuramidase n=1 Tax=Companilactobacillus halodurans TaxID=2584183 RepID=A0A5P0ZZX5_9LACO|nr:GH25 family lysozyme [Companilactobacillus halodurans]MQS98328.1 1,4-beta-N-acetylmuramidase [Companilactobacillus halodurans]
MKLKNKLIYIVSLLIAGLFVFTSPVEGARTDMVDVSNHNGYMTVSNFQDMLNNYGVKSVVTKISEGNYYHDYTAANNISTAQKAGLYINGYHFARYTTVQGAINEADYAGQMAKSDGLPIGSVLITDVEAQEQNGLSRATNNANNVAFMNEVAKYGYRSAVYTMSSWLGSKTDIAQGWIASYPYNASGKQWYSGHHSWQWGSTYQFAGSYGNFDVSQNYDKFFTGGQSPQVDPNETISNVISVKGNSYKAFTTYNNEGKANVGTDVISGTDWKSGTITVINDVPYYLIGGNILLPQSSTTFKNVVNINYRSDYGVLAYDSKGNSIKDSNKTFKGGTSWQTKDKLVNIPNIGYAYEVATNEYISIKYAQGSGFTG